MIPHTSENFSRLQAIAAQATGIAAILLEKKAAGKVPADVKMAMAPANDLLSMVLKMDRPARTTYGGFCQLIGIARAAVPMAAAITGRAAAFATMRPTDPQIATLPQLVDLGLVPQLQTVGMEVFRRP